MRGILSILLLYPLLAISDPIYLGNDKDGLALSPNEAIEKARPFLYESFKMRTSNFPQSESDFWELNNLRIYVLLDGDYYLVVRSLPKKMLLQYKLHAVKVHKFSGELILP